MSYYFPRAAIVQGGDGFLVSDSGLVSDEDDVVALISCFPYGSDSGFWAPTRREYDTRPWIIRFDELAFSQHEEQQIVLLFADWVEANYVARYPDYVSWMRANAGTVRQPLIGGYIHNMLACAAASLVIIGVGAYVRRAGRVSRLRQGYCPTCDYDLRSKIDAGCPECGWRRGEPKG